MSVIENPWLLEEAASQEPVVVAPAPASWSVVAGINAEAAGACGLPVVLSDHYEDIVIVGAHGGAGVSTLAQLTGLVDGGQVWPVSAPVSNRVLVAARTNMCCLRAAQAAALRVFSGGVRGVDVVGVVLVADIPTRRFPRELAEMMNVVKAAYPATICVDWVNDLRLGKSFSRLPARLARTVEQIHALNKAGTQQ